MNYTIDVAAERATLSCAFRSFAGYSEVSMIITPDSFTQEDNQSWFKVISSFYENSGDPMVRLDVPTAIITAKEIGLDELTKNAKKLELLRAIASFPIDENKARTYAQKVQKLRVASLLGNECIQASEDLKAITGAEPISDILSIAENRILEFANRFGGDGDGPTRLGDYVGDYFEILRNTAAPAGLSTGFRRWDIALGGGILPNSVDLVIARAKTGKSLFSNNIALNVVTQNIPVLYIDTEMTREEQLRRLLAIMTRYPENSIRDGLFRNDSNTISKLEAAVKTVESFPYYHQYVGNLSSDDILATIRRWLVKTVGLDENGHAKPCLVIYDYLKLLHSGEMSRDQKEYQTLGFITTGVKNLMGKYQARCIALAQQNREGLDGDDDERSVGGSDRLTWFSTSTSILRWQSTTELGNPLTGGRYTHALIPVLTRHGGRQRKGNFINVSSDIKCCIMKEGPTIDELAQSNVTIPNNANVTF